MGQGKPMKDVHLEDAVRTAIVRLSRERSPEAADRLEAARDAFARSWSRQQGLTPAEEDAPWWMLLGRKSRGTCPDRLPGDDHVSLWRRGRVPEVYVSQPYRLYTHVAAEMSRAAALYGLEFTISTWPAWWNPGAVLFVEWRRAEHA